MQDMIIETINQFGYIGVFLLIAIENIFPPIPSEIILTFSGFATTFSTMSLLGAIIYSTAGSVFGAIILYTLGRIFNTERLENLFDSRLGIILHLNRDDIKRAEKWFVKYGNKAVFFCRFVPIVRSLISIPAGISKMKWNTFLNLTILGTFVWNTALICLGRIAGQTWETIASYIDFYSMIVAVFLGITVILAGVIFVGKRFIGSSYNK